MITVHLEPDYDCIYVELIDDSSRVRIHIHERPGVVKIDSQKELRQVIVESKAETVFVVDRVTREDRLPCDPINPGGYNDFTNNFTNTNRESDLENEHHENREATGDSTYIRRGDH